MTTKTEITLLKIFTAVSVVLSIILFVSLSKMHSPDYRGPILLLFATAGSWIYVWFRSLKVKNKHVKALANFIAYDLPVPMSDKDRDDYIKNVRIPITYYTIYALVGIGLVWVIYYAITN